MRCLPAIKLVLLLLSGPLLQAQDKYWVYHQKDHSPDIKNVLPQPENCSEWLQACTYYLTDDQLRQLAGVGVKTTPVLTLIAKSSPADPPLGFALEQVEAQQFIQKGLTGKGVKIGIIDGGFLDADKKKNLTHLFEKGLVKAYKDYVTPDMKAYGGTRGLDDDHGTEVWNLIGGVDSQKNIRFGLATEAEYYLARTDHGGYERRIEEDFFIEALEWMDSLGVKLVNASVGYNLGFTDPAENYKTSQMDGKTTAIARAVEIAATQKGMLIVVAAGNEGTVKNWQILSTPGDAEHSLTVGASKFSVWDKMNFSSIGPDFVDYVKPDVAVYSTTGTSYSTPVITGMAACIWELHPELTNLEIIRLFQEAGHFYPYPNNYLGYGVPTCTGILNILDGQESPEPKEIHTGRDFIRYKTDPEQKYLVAFHKRDSVHVISRVVYRPVGKKAKVKRLEGATQTSLLIGKEFVEIFWK